MPGGSKFAPFLQLLIEFVSSYYIPYKLIAEKCNFDIRFLEQKLEVLGEGICIPLQ